ncbi:hypothetical protein KBD61_04190 [Patescibacteria group bacterium]|nr:hypothetical protein [Patescibacteria group bacterium]MBP9710195.1 hypothetical protein [Patescibacteria group bacterium]
MLKQQCISITTLRTKTKECLENLSQEPKFVFVNNEPVAALLAIEEYENYFLKPTLRELSQQEASAPLKKAALAARRSRKKDLLNLQ